MAIILDLRQGAAPEDQLIYLKEQLERFLTELEDRGGGVQSIRMIPGEDSLKLIVTDMTGEVSEAEIQKANNIVTIAMQYYLSTSPSEPTGSATGWQSDPPTPVEGKYIWQRSIIIWADGSSASTTPVCPETAAKALTKAEQAKSVADQALEDAATAKSAADAAQSSADLAAGAASAAQSSADAAATAAATADGKAVAAGQAAAAAQQDATSAAQAAATADGKAVAAGQAASAAQSSADAAAGAANTAAQRASEANRKAEAASDSAAQAEREARRAGSYATGALNNLSTVQDIIGVLSWVGDHVVYTWDYPVDPKDSNYDPGQQYFTVVASVVENPVIEDYYKYYLPIGLEANIGYKWTCLDEVDDSQYDPDEQYYTVTTTRVEYPDRQEYNDQEYYAQVYRQDPDYPDELIGFQWATDFGPYDPSEPYYYLEATPVSESSQSVYRDYYTRLGFDHITGFRLASLMESDFDPTHYYVTLTATPVPIEENSRENHLDGLYYTMEPDSAQQAMADYINTHLALTDEGLSVLKAANGWRVLIKNDGVYIIDDLGRVVAKYKDSITLGNDDGSQSFMKEDYHSLQLFDKKNAEILNCDKYDSDSTYEVGDMVYRMDGGTKLYYKCKTAITVPIAWDSTYWERLYPSAYFHVSDLKDAHGIAEITETINIKSEGLTYVDVSYPIAGTDVHVSVNGSDATVTSWTVGGKRVTISQPVLHAGDVVVITYETNDDSDMFAYTFGGRKTGSKVGAMSVAMGQNVEASGVNSHAEGNGTKASGVGSHAEGFQTAANGDFSHAEGYFSVAKEESSHAEGNATSAEGVASHAEGDNTRASGYAAHSEGRYTIASGDNSHVQGKCNIEDPTAYSKTTDTSIVEGKTYYTLLEDVGRFSKVSSPTVSELDNYYEFTPSNAQQAFIIGNGTPDDRSNALTVDWGGRVECGDQSGVLRSIFDIFYPVGSYYETSLTNAIPSGQSTPTATDLANLGTTWFNPEYAWGGTWELEPEGFVHISGSGSGAYKVDGTTYGANTKRIDDANIAHGHDFTKPTVNGGATTTGTPSNNNTGAMSANASHSHSPATASSWFATGKGTRNSIRAQNAGSGNWHTTSTTGWTAETSIGSTNIAHTHSLNNHTHSQVAHTHSVSGGKVEDLGTPSSRTDFNVMQASKAVYRWHRTA